MDTTSLVCPACKFPTSKEFYFCPNCGKQLRSKSIDVSTAKIVGVLLLSFFLPPFGLHPGYRYVRQSNPKTKVIGWTAIVLTIAAYTLALYTIANNMQKFSSIYGTLLQ